MRILILHGWQSVPGGVKPTFLKDHGHEVINPALPDDDMEQAIKIAQAEFDKHQPQVVVGSSRGGAVAMNIKSGDAKLVLLCPLRPADSLLILNPSSNNCTMPSTHLTGLLTISAGNLHPTGADS